MELLLKRDDGSTQVFYPSKKDNGTSMTIFVDHEKVAVFPIELKPDQSNDYVRGIAETLKQFLKP